MAEQPHAVVVGNIEVARGTCSELVEHGFVVTHLLHPTDSEMRAALTSAVGAVAILVRGDVTALRYALLVEHLLPEVRLVVTLFDQTVAEQLVRVVPNCQVTSPANVAVPSIIPGLGGGWAVTANGLPLFALTDRLTRSYEAFDGHSVL